MFVSCDHFWFFLFPMFGFFIFNCFSFSFYVVSFFDCFCFVSLPPLLLLFLIFFTFLWWGSFCLLLKSLRCLGFFTKKLPLATDCIIRKWLLEYKINKNNKKSYVCATAFCVFWLVSFCWIIVKRLKRV